MSLWLLVSLNRVNRSLFGEISPLLQSPPPSPSPSPPAPQHEAISTINKRYWSRSSIAIDSILNKRLSFRLLYNELSMRERGVRIKLLAGRVISSYVNKEELCSEGESYLYSNSESAIDMITIIDAIKDKFYYILKMNL